MTCECVFGDSDCIEHSGDGSAGSPFSFDWVLDPDAANRMRVGAQGLRFLLPDRLIDPPRARVTSTAGQSPTSGTETASTFGRILWDSEGNHDPGQPTRLDANGLGGLYLIIGMIVWEDDEVGTRRLRIMLNGTIEIGRREQRPVEDPDFSGPEDRTVHQVLAIHPVGPDDFVELHVWQNSGGALPSRVVANYGRHFMWHRLGPVPGTGPS